MDAAQISFLTSHPLGDGGLDAATVIAALGQGAWEERYRALIQLGKQLPELPPAWRGEEQELPGCESQVWLLSHQDEAGVWHFAADSQARIVRGLLAVVLAALNHQRTETIRATDMTAYFEALQLAKHLSPSRGNGLRAMVEAIRNQLA
ncbi:MAG: SufE family protein [Aeromonadaceae bacterium]|nr:SufE family protein [Aeromonadaceae bacterium]